MEQYCINSEGFLYLQIQIIKGKFSKNVQARSKINEHHMTHSFLEGTGEQVPNTINERTLGKMKMWEIGNRFTIRRITGSSQNYSEEEVQDYIWATDLGYNCIISPERSRRTESHKRDTAKEKVKLMIDYLMCLTILNALQFCGGSSGLI